MVKQAPSFPCPVCKGDHSYHCPVKDSRQINKVRRRRRQCGNCNQRFTTFEVVVPYGISAKMFMIQLTKIIEVIKILK